MERNDRNGRDAAGVGPYARERESLTPLSTLEWKVSDGEPDIRGWEIRTVSGRQLGSVADLLVDENAGEVVLLDIDLPGTDRHTFVPIRVAQIDRARRIVLMDSADLPDSDLSRVETTRSAGRRQSDAADGGVVRYPRTDRQVLADRAPLADAAPLLDASALDDDQPLVDRRRAERRKIDRISTDL
jgi:hypothetical protein